MSSGNSSETASLFKVTLSIRKDGESIPAYMKQDGQRFKLPRTLKLAVETMYRVDISFKPPQFLESLHIQNIELPCSEKARDSTASAYSGMYATHTIPVSKNGIRHDIPIAMQIGGKGELLVSLQVKFYKCQDNSHSEWGSSLHCIEYECSHTPGSAKVMVTKETYRSLHIQNIELPCSEKARDSTASAYSDMYATHTIPVSKNGIRHDIPIAMQMGGKGELLVSLQVLQISGQWDIPSTASNTNAGIRLGLQT